MGKCVDSVWAECLQLLTAIAVHIGPLMLGLLQCGA